MEDGCQNGEDVANVTAAEAGEPESVAGDAELAKIVNAVDLALVSEEQVRKLKGKNSVHGQMLFST